MKFIHISDLHIGKRVNEMSLLDEQKYILDRICSIVRERKPDAVLIAGDIYDKPVPSAEAVMIFDDFLVALSTLKTHVFVISGNHDSAERTAFGARLMDGSGIHLSPLYDGKIRPVTLYDEYGPVDIYMLPFIKPAVVRYFLPDDAKDDVRSYEDAVSKAIEGFEIDRDRRNVLIAHQFVTGSQRSDSEDVNIGGLDNVDVSVFDDFDYVALGHLHRPQDCMHERIRYSGSPLKYSFSEVSDNKSVTEVILKEKNNLSRNFVNLVPLHDWHDLKGTYQELAAREYYAGTSYQEDFVRITLTDENDIPDAVGKLRTIYHNLMELIYDNSRTRAGIVAVGASADVEKKSPMELFSELYEKQNGGTLNEEQNRYLEDMIKRIWEDKI